MTFFSAKLILMPGIKLVQLFLIIFLILASNFFLLNSSVFAQPSPTGVPTCDLCGWCNQTVNPKPSDWDKCRSCLYDASGTEKSGSYYTVLGCLSTKPEEFVQSMLSIIFGVSGGLAFMSVLYGSAIVLTSSGNPEKIQSGKDLITNSIIGILIIVFSVFLLRVVGFDILQIPGFG